MDRVLVVDDHPLVAMVLAEQARAAFEGARIESAASLAEAIETARAMGGAEYCLLDLGLPGCIGLEALTRFRTAYAETRVIVVSAVEARAVVLGCLEAGAAGYIPKTSSPTVVTAALRLVAGGGTYVPPQVLESVNPIEDDLSLTGRQREVLCLIARGLANKEIAQSLHIARDTVKQHAKAVYAALGVKSRAQAARAARLHGIKFD
jgi:DNA-binding NarL/FixJ family response regulator